MSCCEISLTLCNLLISLQNADPSLQTLDVLSKDIGFSCDSYKSGIGGHDFVIPLLKSTSQIFDLIFHFK